MLTRADDYPIHQTAEPIAYAGTDRNFYDRYFFNGYSPDGSVFFAAALGVYPALNVMDGAFCLVVDGVQHNLRVSRLMHMERMQTRVGPLAVEVVEPLERLRVRVEENEHGISADIVFTARAAAIEEPRFTHRIGPRTVMDYTRLTQNGRYEGWIRVKGRTLNVGDGFMGTRDRSWGVRPVGAPDSQGVAPPAPPQFCWIWTPLNFEGCMSFFHDNADAEGRSWNRHGVVVFPGGQPAEHFSTCSSHLAFKPGTRHARQASIVLGDAGQPAYRIDVTPLWNFYMSGLGYTHPEWGHGRYHGELRVGYDSFATAEVNEAEFLYLHVQAVSRAVLTEASGKRHEGIGVLEQLIIGPSKPHGFKSLLDGAS